MQVTSQLFSPAHSPSELAPMHVQPITLQDIYYLLLRLPAFIQIKSGIFSKNGFSYEYHYDFNQLTALYLKMLAPKSRLSLRSKDDCIVRLWLRCDGCDFTLPLIVISVMSCVSLLLIFFRCSCLITGMASIHVPEQPNPKELANMR